VWAAAAPLLQDLFFHTLSVGIVALAGVTVFTQLLMTVGKVCLQGVRDDRGSNLVIATEEIAFLPPYLVGLALHADGVLNILVALAVADLAVAAQAWGRMARRGAVRGSLRPSVALARRIVGYGVRGQVGGVMTLLNLRFDFAILGALVSPAVLGTYAIASKYAELLRLPGLAVTWVVYPRVARGGGVPGAALRRLLPRALALGVACAIPLALAAGVVLPWLYGEEFSASVVPAYILIGGLVGEVAAGLATAYLYGAGRPGLNSIAMAVGVAVTVVLDLLLIPRYGATGAAVASATTYLLADGLLILMMLRHSARHGVAASGALVPAPGAPAP
jgi:O-antigen/teichoic acid export membrane protein